jgi:acetolactate synthase-1/2/3 large subunit
MRFTTAATSLVLATALTYSAAFTPTSTSTSFGVSSSPSSSKKINNAFLRPQHTTANKSKDSSLFIINEESLSDILSSDTMSSIEIEEGTGDIISSIDVARKSATSYLSNYKGQSGASIVYSKLVENSVDVVNGYSGGAVLPLLDQFHEDHPRHEGLDKPPIRWITNSNENSAGHIAEGYAKSAPQLKDGKQPAGVVIATSGPGVTNLITPLQDAICDGVPMVVLCGQAATTAPQDAFQQAPAVDLTRPCTKWSYQIKNAAELPMVLDYAFFIARNGRPGPVFVDLPKDLQNQVLDEGLIEEFANNMPLKVDDVTKGGDNYDGIVRLFPRHVGANGDAGVGQYAMHLGLPEKGILFDVTADNKAIEPVHGLDLDTQEELHHLDHNPSDTIYSIDADTNEETTDELKVGSKLVKKIHSMLKKAKKPLIIAGQGCNECPDELKEFAEALQIPVATTLHGLGCFDEREDLALNMVGMHGHPTPNYMTQEADFLICIGSRFDDRITGRLGDFIPEARKAAEEYRGGVIHVDIRVTEKSKQVKPTYFVHSTAKQFLNTMNEEFKRTNVEGSGTATKEWLAHKKTLETEFPVKVPFFPNEKITKEVDGNSIEVDRTRMSAQSVVTEMNRQILEKGVMDDCVFSTGVGIHQMVSAQLITWTQPKQMVSSGSLGTMGVALGFVIGCKLANGHKMCIAVDGDGSFNMTFTELKTVAEQKIPVKIMILDNESQMMVEYWQRLFHDARYLAVTNTVNPDYGKLADSFGIKNLYVDCEENLEEVMQQFLFDDPEEPVLLHARIERTPCLPLVAPGAPLQDMILEDTQTEGGFDASAAPS